jgi:outer membrane protein OmpA-like peptidoglycan-associated protein
MRCLPILAALLITGAASPSVAGEKIGLQSVRATGERIGMQSERATQEPLGLQTESKTEDHVGLQTPEKGIDTDVMLELWGLAVSFRIDDVFVDTPAYKQLHAIADLLSEHPATFIYIQGITTKGEKDPNGLNLAEHRAVVAMAYLQLFGINPMVMELVQPGTPSAKSMAKQMVRHRALVVAQAKAAGVEPPEPLTRAVRFGVVEQH